MKSLVVLLFIPSALLRRNTEGFVNAESTPGAVTLGKASDGYLLTQGTSEQKRIITKDERPDNRPGKCQTRHDPTPTTHRTSSNPRRQSVGVSQSNYAKVKAQVLKKTTEVKINRTCGSEMGFLFIPHSYIYVTTKDSKAGAFKMLPHIEDNVLPLSWKAYLPEDPFTATKRKETETKWYRRTLAESNDGPCDEDHDLFSSGIDSEEDEAIFPMEKDDQSEGCSEGYSEGCSEDASEEHQLRNSIDRVLKGVYKAAEDGRKVLITKEELDSSMKEELIKYCQLLKKVDTSGTLEEHQMGSEMDVFDNLVRLLLKHRDETVFTLRRKLRNPAVCMKNVGEWVLKRRGLALPDS
uniref:Pcy-TSERA1 protein n=1 Tax=Plasmodium cynomolgi TaxID=5827 RepID=F1SYU7_9APIC|nr:Pcy-TSERA1 [Plasmodium cynomolgi]